MRTGRPSYARTGSARAPGSGPWPAPRGDRPGQADRARAPTPRERPWGPPDARRAPARDVAGNPGTLLMITSGLARFSWFLLHSSEIYAPRARVPRPAGERRVVLLPPL